MADSLFKLEGGCYIQSPSTLASFDLLVSEAHGMESEVAEHPVDGASAVATHIYNKLRQGSFTVLVSNFSYTNAQELKINNREQFIESTRSGNFNAFADKLTNRGKGAYDVLKKIWEERQLVTIALGLEVYKDTVITNVSAVRDGDSGDAQRFNISFRQIKQVTLKKTKLQLGVSSVDTNADPENRQAAEGVDLGTQTNYTSSDAGNA